VDKIITKQPTILIGDDESIDLSGEYKIQDEIFEKIQ